MAAERTRLCVSSDLFRSLVVSAFLICAANMPIPASAQGQWERVAGTASDIALADDGTAWIVGATPAEKVPGGYRIFMAGPGSAQRTAVAGAALRIAVEGKVPWAVNEGGAIYRWDGRQWVNVSGPKAVDIGASGKGVWLIGADPARGNVRSVFQRTGNTWKAEQMTGSRLAVDADGNPWVVEDRGLVWVLVGGVWKVFNLAVDATGRYEKASDIAVDIFGYPWVVTDQGDLWQFRKDGVTSRWERRAQSASAVAQRGGHTWYAGKQNEIFRSVSPPQPATSQATTVSFSPAYQAERVAGVASDIASADDGSVWLVGGGDANKVGSGYKIFMVSPGSRQLTEVAEVEGGALRIAVKGNTPFIIDGTGYLKQWENGRWKFYGSSSVDLGANAKTLYSLKSSGGRFADGELYRYTAPQNVVVEGSSVGVRLDVDDRGGVWAVTSTGELDYHDGRSRKPFKLPTDARGQVELASDVAVDVGGSPWVVSKRGYLWRFNVGSNTWHLVAQGAHAVASRGDNTWVLGAKGEIFRMKSMPVAAAPAPAKPAASTSPLSWTAVSGRNVPSTALIAGKHKSGTNLAVCRADMGDGIHPGKVWGANCNVGWGGREVARPSYEVLSASPDAVKWVGVQPGRSVPANAVVAGKHKSGPNLLVCRADMGDGIHPGKVWNGRCHVGWGGKEVVKPAFEVLVSASP